MFSEKITDGWSFHQNGHSIPVTLPHDFMLSTPRTPDSPTCADYGYFQPCKGIYTRKIIKSSADVHIVRFDGVMGLCEVYINNEKAAFHPYGYTAFEVDISRYLHDGENELRVEVDASCQPASRWYTGAGIYREVELLTSSYDRFAPCSLAVRTLGIDDENAWVELSADIVSSSDKSAKITFSVPEIGFSVTRGLWLSAGRNSFKAKTVLHGIRCWSTDEPVMYTLKAELLSEGSRDEAVTSFGVRTIICDPERGLLINGRETKLYGTCNHHDNGIVGAASLRSAEERRIRILKENGFNAIRCSHNPPSSVLLDVCDRMGMLVIDELFDCWRTSKRPYDYHLWFDKYAEEDIKSTVVRDRNHPSVIMWSTGNEIYERGGAGDGYAVGGMIADTVKKYDPDRPLTHAFCMFWDNWAVNDLVNETFDKPASEPDYWCEKIAPQAGSLDVLGYNYLAHRIDKDEKIFTSHLFMITESYPMDAAWVKGLMDCHKKLIGEFVWTGWDYFGETGIGRVVYDDEKASPWCGLDEYPKHISNCGDFDICGFKKASSYYRRAVWNKGSVSILTEDPGNFGRVKVVSAWGFYDVERTWTYPGKEGKTTEVYIFTTADECELFANGESLGRKKPNERGIAVFETEYYPGVLEAAGYIGGEISGKDELLTVSEAVSIKVVPDTTGKSGKADMIYAEIYLLDKDGNIAWTADGEITVAAQGGRVVGTGSGKIDAEHDYTNNICKAYHGRILAAIVPESDSITVTAECGNMRDSVIAKIC